MKIEYVHKMGDQKKPFSAFEDTEIPENIKISLPSTAACMSRCVAKVITYLGTPR